MKEQLGGSILIYLSSEGKNSGRMRIKVLESLTRYVSTYISDRTEVALHRNDACKLAQYM